MLHLQSEIDLAASPDQVWAALADFPSYPNWNPFIRNISGEHSVGARLNVTIQPDGGPAMTFKPELRVFAPGRELRWKGQLLWPGVFDGEHYFQLSETTSGGVHLAHGEVFTGLLVHVLLRGSALTRTQRGFVAMNRALKALVEKPQRR